MNREDIEKLLGGYATGTLTEEERRALFEAALDDQGLFEALAREQALREVLDDPAARGELLAALDRPSRAARFWAWLRQPAVAALAASLATALIMVAVWVPRRHVEPTPVQMARSMDDSAPPPVPPAAAPATQAAAPEPAVRRVVREKAKTAPEPESKAVAQAPSDLVVLPGDNKDAAKQESMVVAEPPTAPPVLALRDKADAPAPYGASAGVVGGVAGGPLRSRLERQSAPRAFLTNGFSARADVNLGLRYSVLRLGAEGLYLPVAPGAALHTGDSIRLNLQADEPGYLYILQGEDSGGWRALYDQRIEAAKAYLLPSGGALTYDRPGRKEFYVLIARQPYQPLQVLLGKEGRGNSVLDAAALPAASMRIVLDVK